MIWIPITVGAAGFQVARNVMQRGLLAGAGPWGATLVRFLFGVPFACLFVIGAAVVSPGTHPTLAFRFWAACVIGGGAQIGATAALLVSMRRGGFAMASVFQQCGVPLAAVFGLALGETLSGGKWLGIALVGGGLVGLSWPQRAAPRDWTAAPLGLAAGAGFALASNAFRQGALAADAHHPLLAAQVTLLATQVAQSAALVAWLSVADQKALAAAVRPWRASLAAGFFGAAASALWFTAFALSPAGPVRAVGVIEAPVAALAGRRLFAERLGLRQLAFAGLAAVGVALAALG